jgi:hypothetical protein
MDSVGLARVSAFAFGVLLTAGPSGRAQEAQAPLHSPLHLEVWADRDDDDANGAPDGEQDRLPAAARVDLVPLDDRFAGASFEPVSGGEHVRVVSADGPLAWGRPSPSGVWVQGLTPGHAELVASGRKGRAGVSVDVLGIEMRDGSGQAVDMARSHASLERLAPARLEGSVDAPYDDFDALRVVVSAPDDGRGYDRDRDVSVESISATGARIDSITKVALAPAACTGSAPGLRCRASAPLRFVIDEVDRDHPLVAGRSLKAEVGGAIVFRSDLRKAQMIRLLGPRTSPAGPIGRLRANVHAYVVRVSPGGAPAIGGTDAGAAAVLRAELGTASAIWGQCGLSFGDVRQLEVKIVDPPPSHLVSIGDSLGIFAGGGDVRLRADGKPITVRAVAGQSPDWVAAEIARAAERAGLVAVVSPNARIGPAISSSVDVSLRRKDGTLVSIDAAPGLPMSTDPMLSVRIGSVDLSDGLQHFTDMDAMAGTLEERTLLKAIDDGDPTTIEVVVVPLFAGGGRIGESFIGSDLSSVRNVILLDRAGIRARKSSLTLAHELGHVLMDLPGHPDDYGVDSPTLLMDSDAADASPFGPRRITVDECARVVRQAGPKARTPLLADWPITPIPYDPRH